LQAWIASLIKSGHDPRRLVVEVYDHAEPAARFREVLSVEALPSGQRIVLAVIWTFDHIEDRIDVVEQPGARPSRDMDAGRLGVPVRSRSKFRGCGVVLRS
jgi:hypothetical protein